VARLALASNAPVDFTTPHWQPLVASEAPLYFRALGGTVASFGGLRAVHGVRNEVVVHPLWAKNHPDVVQAGKEAVAAGISQLHPKTLFDLVRRPF